MTSSASGSSYGVSGYDQIDDHDRTVDDGGVRKGPWTEEEDTMLVNYVTAHGEGHWNDLARSAGLNRTGKSCRLRWLNYLRPDVRRGNISLQEQLLILQLHSRWGNRWSKIARELPGRTDNEIKNYWRTRVQKQAKQLKCDVSSQEFRDTMTYVWMPRLAERIQAASVNPDSKINTDATQTVPNSSETTSWDAQVSPVSDQTESYYNNNNSLEVAAGSSTWLGDDDVSGVWGDDECMMSAENMVWSDENVWFLQEQLYG